MRMPWFKRNESNSKPARIDKSTAALAGPAGDGLVHDLQYWLDSGFLTIPQSAIDAQMARAQSAAAAASGPTGARPTPRPGGQAQPE
jgi:hypothetical protein